MRFDRLILAQDFKWLLDFRILLNPATVLNLKETANFNSWYTKLSRDIYPSFIAKILGIFTHLSLQNILIQVYLKFMSKIDFSPSSFTNIMGIWIAKCISKLFPFWTLESGVASLVFLFTQILLRYKTPFQTPLWYCLSFSSSYWSPLNHFQWGCAAPQQLNNFNYMIFYGLPFLIFYNACILSSWVSIDWKLLNDKVLISQHAFSTILYL